jgi:hypothetical protein
MIGDKLFSANQKNSEFICSAQSIAPFYLFHIVASSKLACSYPVKQETNKETNKLTD